MERPTPHRRADYAHVLAIPTRWMDNDVYGHVNNVVYYSFFDTVVARFLIDNGVLDIAASPAVGLVVETKCNYFKPLAFPDTVDAGLRVAQRGTSSLRYEIALFKNGDDDAAAQGHFVHVYVDRATNRPVPLPDKLTAALAKLVVVPPSS